MKTSRREIIKTMFREKGEVKLKELEERFPDCSSMTLRRDIKFLEDQGLVKRTRGGAVALGSLMIITEDAYHMRAIQNTVRKHDIAKHAIPLFEKGQSIFIDAGTTMMFFVREMPDETCNILTSGLNIALELTKKDHPMVSIIGGQVDRHTIAASGVDSAEYYVAQFDIDTAFIASSGFTFENGLSCGTYTECGIKREVVKKAKRTILLMDSTKFGKDMPFSFGMPSDIDIIITDDGIDASYAKRIKELGIQLLT